MSITRLKPVDVVVVGVGVAGSIVCKELAQTGLRVVGLERGRMIDPAHDFAMPYVHDELKYDRHSDIIQNLSRETVTFRNSMHEGALPVREVGSFKPGECVGGAGVHWGGSAFRFLPWDFEVRSRTHERYGRKKLPQDCTSQDWGLTYDELEPYYDQFEQIYGIGGKAGNLNGEIQVGGNPYEGPRSREFPNPPTIPTYPGSIFGKAAAELGYKPFPKPTASMTRPYVNPYKLMLGACVHGGFCANHGCAMGAKATPLSTVVPALLKHQNFELRTHANVLKVNLDSDRKRAVSVTYMDARGRTVEQPADLIILTGFTFNNTRLLLLSGIGQPYDPLRNEGVVGRNYSYQPWGKVQLFFEDKVFKRFMAGGGMGTVIDDFNAEQLNHADLGFIGGAQIGVQSSGALPIRSRPVPRGTPRWGSAWKQAVAHYYDRSIHIGLNITCQSYRGSYLDLDPTYRDAHNQPLLRMTFNWHENERRTADYLTKQAVEIGKAMGASRMGSSSSNGDYSVTSYQSTHNVGGAVMGMNPATSVVNKYLQSWDVSNVFVVGGSAFPQNSASGPTETIGALACWTADMIRERYLKQPGALV